jgi:3-oxoadipate enol-lactonase
MERWLTPAFRAAHPDRAAATRALLLATPAPGYAGCCAAIAGMDLRPLLPRITAATLVITGADDPATPVARAEEIVAGIAGARLTVLPGVAHLPGVQQPVRLGELIGDHVGAQRE